MGRQKAQCVLWSLPGASCLKLCSAQHSLQHDPHPDCWGTSANGKYMREDIRDVGHMSLLESLGIEKWALLSDEHGKHVTCAFGKACPRRGMKDRHEGRWRGGSQAWSHRGKKERMPSRVATLRGYDSTDESQKQSTPAHVQAARQDGEPAFQLCVKNLVP